MGNREDDNQDACLLLPLDPLSHGGSDPLLRRKAGQGIALTGQPYAGWGTRVHLRVKQGQWRLSQSQRPVYVKDVTLIVYGDEINQESSSSLTSFEAFTGSSHTENGDQDCSSFYKRDRQWLVSGMEKAEKLSRPCTTILAPLLLLPPIAPPFALQQYKLLGEVDPHVSFRLGAGHCRSYHSLVIISKKFN
ncbi:hypothetical protein GOP47_0013474 [Adiantum capillus-veneris]|uniref:Uncharacterized protein n=1 Tax=Adiantum capillus-veneris TaxID=13818 RepID=A0A9D4UPU7_ADICA|nr:hypothetical protein GOP47_0013474 [Adiantum capillus-veneris]